MVENQMTKWCKMGFIYSLICIIVQIKFMIYQIYSPQSSLSQKIVSPGGVIGRLICIFIPSIYSCYVFYNHCKSKDNLHKIVKGLNYIVMPCFILGIIIALIGWRTGPLKNPQKTI